MFRVDSSRFNNYPAYEFNLERLDFYQVGNKDLYIVCRAGGSTDDCVQTGSQEYINGWLYGAVQAACGQLRKRMESYPELRNYDEDHQYDMNREPDEMQSTWTKPWASSSSIIQILLMGWLSTTWKYDQHLKGEKSFEKHRYFGKSAS